MKKTEIKIPEVGESVTEAEIASWEKEHGSFVQKGEILAVIETDKASMEIPAERAGRLKIITPAGERASVGDAIGFLEDAEEEEPASKKPEAPGKNPSPAKQETALPPSQAPPSPSAGLTAVAPGSPPPLSPAPADGRSPQTDPAGLPDAEALAGEDWLFSLSPSVRHAVGEAVGKTALKPEDLTALKQAQKSGRAADVLKILQERESRGPGAAPSATTSAPVGGPPFADVKNKAFVAGGASPATDSLNSPADSASAAQTSAAVAEAAPGGEGASLPSQRRERMTVLRRAIARRLVQSQQTTATLTTFNEADMSRLKEMRLKYRDSFIKKHGVKLGFMGFFVKAVCFALKKHPQLNGFIEGEDIVYNNFCHIGVAVSVEGGLLVPVIRKADEMSLPDVEKQIKHFSEKARRRALQPQELSGGTFTLSNGGVFGSLLSTPVLNPPQSGVLGMHAIQNRPVALEGRTEIRPMMYLALSYDHRIADGKEAVGFLSKVKAAVEEPARMLIDI